MSGASVKYTSKGYNYSVRAVSPLGSAVEISSPYRTSAASAPTGQRYATVSIELTNEMPDRAVPLDIATVGDIDFSFAVARADSQGLDSVWQGNCTSSLGAPANGPCVDLATRVQSTDPSHVDELEPKIPAGGTVTMHLYSSAIPTTLNLSKLMLLYIDPIEGTKTQISLVG